MTYLILLIALAAMGRAVYIYYRRHHMSIQLPGAPVLLSYYTRGAEIYPIKQGRIGGMHYSAFLTAGSLARREFDVDQALLYRVELPYSSRIHLLGIPRRSGARQLNPAAGKSIMEKVDLEGDYYNYFTLYAEKDMQAESRYVLDPKAMVFTVDFCQSHNWEIVRNELYFVQVMGTGSDDDPTHMFADIEQFVAEIRPALEKPLTAEELACLTPYGKDRRQDLACPVCGTILENKDVYFVCPKHHGVLATGAALRRIKQGELAVDLPLAEFEERQSPLKCPSCRAEMQHVRYNGSDLIIDSCRACHYRWLDAHEAVPATPR